MGEASYTLGEGAGTDSPGARKRTAGERGVSLAAATQTVPSRDEARQTEIRGICLREFGSAKVSLQLVDVKVDAARRAATVFFTSESKVDFRELCRALCRQLHMRVTLYRLGPRDLAKRTGTCGPCGRPLCCKSFLSGCPAVSVKLVKEQKFPLTPERSAGMCGRLKCCFAFERADGTSHQATCGCRLDAASADTGSSPDSHHLTS